MTDKTNNIKNLEKKHHLQIYNRFDLSIAHGKGTRLYDHKGKEYIDALAGIAVCGLGHCHPAVTKAITRQANELIHVSNLFYTESQSNLAQLLTKSSGMDKAFFCNSGAEAVEGAVKIARKYGALHKKTGDVISMSNCFHGRTLATVAMGKKKYQEGFDPMPSGFRQVPFNDIEALEQAVNKSTVAIIIEPLQGEGGIHPAKQSFMKRARELCDKYNCLMIMDEIQCGLGRTGTLFAFEQYDIKPDIVTLAKALGNGFPIGAVLVNDNIVEPLNPGDHGTTYGGNPLACAAAFATLRTIIDENMPENVHKKGEFFIEALNDVAKKHSLISEVRGKGLMIGVELTSSAGPVVTTMRNNGVIAGLAGPDVIRFLPPYIITEKELLEVARTLDNALQEAAR